MKWCLIERLHRYVFDVIYDQKYKITIIDLVVLWFYNRVTIANHDWRYNLYLYSKSLNRYSNISRLTPKNK